MLAFQANDTGSNPTARSKILNMTIQARQLAS